MQIIAREVRNYITPEGRNPFRQWLTQLQDKRARANKGTQIMSILRSEIPTIDKEELVNAIHEKHKNCRLDNNGVEKNVLPPEI